MIFARYAVMPEALQGIKGLVTSAIQLTPYITV